MKKHETRCLFREYLHRRRILLQEQNRNFHEYVGITKRLIASSANPGQQMIPFVAFTSDLDDIRLAQP